MFTRFASLAALAVCVAADGSVLAQCVVPPIRIVESQFSSWSIIHRFGNNPGAATGGAFAGDGSPTPPSYEVVHALSSTAGSQTTILACHSGPAAIYDPRALGAIASVNWSLEYRWINGACCAGQGYALYAEQGGAVYATKTFATLEAPPWRSHQESALTALDFEPAPFQNSTPPHPDFSNSGAPIQFGVLTSNSTAADGTGYLTRTRFDTFDVEIQSLGCPSDFDCDGFVSGIDYDLYVLAFESGESSADFDRDGFVTGIDFDFYVAAFEAGC